MTKIQELARRATEFCSDKEWKDDETTAWVWEETFAKYIIEECADLCLDSYHTPDGFGITNADQRCHDLILSTFGVTK